MIDSELVPWGKGEKQAGKADEIEPETICLQGTEARQCFALEFSIINLQFSLNFQWVNFQTRHWKLKIRNWKLELPMRSIESDRVPIEEWANEFR